MDHSKECAYCRQEFESGRSDANYCSGRCRTAAHRDPNGERPMTDRLPFHEKPSQSIIYVDPAMARRVLAKNIRNRRISELHVQKLMREMEDGRWQYNGESIKWSTDDALLDGQHRLTALSRLPDDFGTLPFLVIRGLPSSAQDTMDQGKVRSAADQMAIDDLLGSKSDARIVAGAIRVYLQWSGTRMFGNRFQDVSNPEVVAWAHANPVELHMLDDIVCADLRRVKSRPSLTLAVMLIFRKIDGEAQREFAAALYTGTDLPKGSPILALRDKLDRIRERKLRTSDRDYVAFYISAWNAWRDGRSMKDIRRPVGGEWSRENFPEPK